jgi:hypothetical protein
MKLDEASATQPSRQGQPEKDPPADAATPARCAADLLLEHFKHDWDELAGFLDEADPHELLKHLRQGCAARKGQAA